MHTDLTDDMASILTLWENLFVVLKGVNQNKDIIIANIYKPPKDNYNVENIRTFTAEFKNIISDLKDTNNEILIAGDYDINLLDLDTRQAFEDFFDSMISTSFYPKITLPTRLDRNKATLIDNICFKLSPLFNNTEADILYTKMSDHFPYFIGSKLSDWYGDQKTRLVKKRITTKEALNNILADLTSTNIISRLNLNPYADLNHNYNVLRECVTDLKNKHLPYKLVKFNKYKHKGSKWTTNGKIRSLKYRDNIYRGLKKTDQCSPTYEVL